METRNINRNGVILYEGPSLIDGAPIVVIATGLKKPSKNAKTADMVQTWILRKDIHPKYAVRSGDDVSICGQCPHRMREHLEPDGSTKTLRTCYVNMRTPITVLPGRSARMCTPCPAVALEQCVAGQSRETSSPPMSPTHARHTFNSY